LHQELESKPPREETQGVDDPPPPIEASLGLGSSGEGEFGFLGFGKG